MLHKCASIVVKYGGNAMGAEADDAILAEIAALRAAGCSVVLVHGGGPEIDEALKRQGVATERVDGLRVTGAEALGVAEAVLCATANKRLVRACLRYGIPAVGISGQDGGLVQARKAASPGGHDLGFVGEVAGVDPGPLQALLAAGYMPVVSPIALGEGAHHALNVNADTVAGAIAAALRADAYVALTNVARVLRDPHDPSSAIDSLSVADAERFACSNACSDGMRPKMRAAIDAVRGGAARSFICGTKPGAISGALAGEATTIASLLG